MRRNRFRAALVLSVGLVAFVIGPAALAADPVEYANCVSSYKPYKVFSSTAGINVMRAESHLNCETKFQNCLERSSWTGYRTVRCNEWANVDKARRTGLTGFYWVPIDTTRKVSGCVKGTYDYHTKTTWVDGYGNTSRVVSEAYKAFYCSKDV